MKAKHQTLFKELFVTGSTLGLGTTDHEVPSQFSRASVVAARSNSRLRLCTRSPEKFKLEARYGIEDDIGCFRWTGTRYDRPRSPVPSLDQARLADIGRVVADGRQAELLVHDSELRAIFEAFGGFGLVEADHEVPFHCSARVEVPPSSPTAMQFEEGSPVHSTLSSSPEPGEETIGP